MSDHDQLDFSIVIPLLNAEASLETLYAQITDVMSMLDLSYEVIFVDDGSTDDSFSILQKLHRENGNVVVIQFRRNFGKAAGLTALHPFKVDSFHCFIHQAHYDQLFHSYITCYLTTKLQLIFDQVVR